MRSNLSLLCFLAAISFSSSHPLFGQTSGTGPVVKTESGFSSGSSVAAGEVSVFKGVPYATPPVGTLRWRPPKRAGRWEEVRPATKFGPSCETNEDCLYLNVWTPADALPASLPVMVWIHGGGFSSGAGSHPVYDGTRFAQAGVVLITINYRLHFFGAFAHPELSRESPHGSSGNYSLMDQIEALKWIQRNVGAFGGDPTRVTIFGQSAGGRSVSALMVSPLAKGLFHRAIGHSGALRDVSFTLNSREEIGVEIAKAVGCNIPDALTCLRGKSLEQLMVARSVLNTNPIVDGWVIPEDPVAMYAKGDQHDVPMIIGSNAHEATFWWGDGLRFHLPATYEEYQEYFRDVYGTRADQVLAFYDPVNASDLTDAFIRYQTDVGLTVPARSQARWMTNVSSDAYLYFFSRVPPDPKMKRWGASHSTETRYVFNTFEGSDTDRIFGVGDPTLLEDVDWQLSTAMMTYWVRFAASGNPNGEGLPHWTPYGLATDSRMELGTEIKMRRAVRGPGENLLQLLMLETYLTGETRPSPIAR